MLRVLIVLAFIALILAVGFLIAYLAADEETEEPP